MSEPDEPAAGDGPADLLVRLLTDLVQVLQGDVLLARAEIARGLRGMGLGLVLMIVAALLAMLALNALAAAALLGLVALGLPPVWASVVLGLGLLLLAYAGLRVALALLNPGNLIPIRSLSRLFNDLAALKPKGKSDAQPEIDPSRQAQPEPDRGGSGL